MVISEHETDIRITFVAAYYQRLLTLGSFIEKPDGIACKNELMTFSQATSELKFSAVKKRSFI